MKLVSTECMTKKFYNLFKEKVPNHSQLAARDLATRLVTVYDDLVSKDSYTVRRNIKVCSDHSGRSSQINK